MSGWEGLTRRGGNVPAFKGRKRGRPSGSKNIMPRTKKDEQQDRQIKNVQKHVKKIIRTEELNHVDIFINNVAMLSNPSTAQTILLNPLQQGNNNDQRVGDEVMFTSIQIKGYVLSDKDAVSGGQECRIIAFWDKSPNGVAPTAANLLDNSVIIDYVNAPYNQNYYTRFKILYDKRFNLNAQLGATYTTGATDTLTSVYPVTMSLEFRKSFNKKTNYGLSNMGTIADIARGACYLLILSTVASGTNQEPTLRAGVRMIFKDL